MDINLNFIKDWKKYGDDHEGEWVDQFFYYFVAFNCLYENVFTGLHTRIEDRERKTDRYKIEEFRRSDTYKHIKQNGFAPCSDLNLIPELAQGVKDAGTHSVSSSRNKIFMNDEDWINEKKLLMSIYQVRCNLFHGHKYIILMESRNYRLIKECVWVLRNLLEAYLKG